MHDTKNAGWKKVSAFPLALTTETFEGGRNGSFSSNTPLLPKISATDVPAIGVLCTGIAATALTAVPVLAALPDRSPDAALIAACDDWVVREQCAEQALSLAGQLFEEATAKEPPVPGALFEELDLPVGPRALKGWAESGKTFHIGSTEADGMLTSITAWLPIPEATRTRAAELLVIHERHERAKRRVWAKEAPSPLPHSARVFKGSATIPVTCGSSFIGEVPDDGAALDR